MSNKGKEQKKETAGDISELPTVVKYLNCSNIYVQRAVEQLIMNVHSMATQTAGVIQRNRELLSDATDHLDGILSGQLNMTQAEEIQEIIRIGEELSGHFDKKIQQLVFPESVQDLDEKKRMLIRQECKLRQWEKELEKEKRISEVGEHTHQELASANKLLLSALKKTERVFDQNKISRFVYSTILKFQWEFTAQHVRRDADYLSRLFLQTIEPIQQTEKVAKRGGKDHRMVVNTFSDSCYDDLFSFFCKYYYELLELYEEKGSIPSTADEVNRIFKNKGEDAGTVIANTQKR